MNTPRKAFLCVTTLLIVGTIAGVAVLTVTEHQARAALPPDQQTTEAIATLYDGAVCLSCDFGQIFLTMFGSVAVVITLLAWGVYEVGRVFLAWHARAPR